MIARLIDVYQLEPRRRYTADHQGVDTRVDRCATLEGISLCLNVLWYFVSRLMARFIN